MAIIEFINKPNRSYTGMKNVINYVLNPQTTNDNLITGIGLYTNDAYNNMVTLKSAIFTLYHMNQKITANIKNQANTEQNNQA